MKYILPDGKESTFTIYKKAWKRVENDLFEAFDFQYSVQFFDPEFVIVKDGEIYKIPKFVAERIIHLSKRQREEY